MLGRRWMTCCVVMLLVLFCPGCSMGSGLRERGHIPAFWVRVVLYAPVDGIDADFVRHSYFPVLKERWATSRVRLRLKDVKVVGELPCPDPGIDLVRLAKLATCYERWATSRWGRDKKRDVVLHLVPPFMAQGRRWFGGVAIGQCNVLWGRMHAVATVGLHNTDGLDRFDHSVLVGLHEMGHLFGASHLDDGPNVMHPAAGHFCLHDNNCMLPWDSRSKFEILTCTRVNSRAWSRKVKRCKAKPRGQRGRCLRHVRLIR